MNNLIKRFGSALLILSATLLNSCNVESQSYSIGPVGISGYWLQETSDDPNLAYNNIIVECYNQLYNYNFGIYIGDGLDPETTTQVDQLETFVGIGCTIIAFMPINKDGYSDVLKDAKAAGVGTICINSEIDAISYVDAFVGTDNEYAGYQLAQHLAGIRPEGGNIIIVRGISYADDDRAESFKTTISSYPVYNVIEIYADGVRNADGVEIMEDAINEGLIPDEVVAIFGTSDELALGASSVLSETMTGYEVYGVDCTEDATYAIVDYEMTATVAHDYTTISSTVAEIAYKMASGFSYDSNTKIRGTLLDRNDMIE